MEARSGLGEFEHLVLLVVLRLGRGAFGPDIGMELERSVGRSVTRGALYSALNRLEDKGLLRWAPEPPSAERGGHVRRLFSVTDEGVGVLRERRAVLQTLWSGLEATLEDGS